MELINFLKRESPGTTAYILLMSTIYGITAGIFAPLVLQAATEIMAGKNYWLYMAILPCVVVVQILSYRLSQSKTALLSETASQKLVLSIANTIRQDLLPDFEKRNHSEIHLNIINAQMITEGVTHSINVFENLIILLVLWCYTFHLSGAAGIIFLLILGLILLVQEVSQKITRELFHQIAKEEEGLFNIFRHFLDGFKEIKIRRSKNNDLFTNYLKPFLQKIRDLRYRLVFLQTDFTIFVSVSVSIFMCITVFFLPSLRLSHVAVHILIITLYLVKPARTIFTALPKVNKGQVALNRLQRLAKNQYSESNQTIYHPEKEIFKELTALTLKEICFTYHDEDGLPGFSVGPINLTVNSGELLFIAGGNGSGKSTLAKILTGLYPPESGEMAIDGRRISMHDHRYLFGAVFSDFHLFESLYGVDSPDEHQIHRLLADMELTDKTNYLHGRFSTLDLSSGQRRRLAMVAALLEDKPVYLFDEWAADQDPCFRKYFYHNLLPYLKQKGKTVFVVTHDDNYYSVADRIIHMEFGKITHDSPPGVKQPTALFDSASLSAISDNGTKIDGDHSQPESESEQTITTEPSDSPDREISEYKLESPPLLELNKLLPVLKKLGWSTALDGITSVMRMHILFTVVNLPVTVVGTRFFFLLIITLILEFILTRHFNAVIIETIEDFIGAARTRLIDRVRRLSLSSLENIGSDNIYTALTSDLRALGDASFMMAVMLRFAGKILCMLIYFAFLAWPIFLVELAVIIAIGVLYGFNQIRLKESITKLREEEAGFFRAITHLLQGFKELRLNDRKSDIFFHQHLEKLCDQVNSLKQKTVHHLMGNTTLVYGTWTALVAILPLIQPFIAISDRVLFTCIGILFFLPINILIIALPPVLQAAASIRRLSDLEQNLETMNHDFVPDISKGAQEPFGKLNYKDIIFHYMDKNDCHFHVGPLNLILNAGEIIFITGGNGSGKSTLFKLMAGLYLSEEGAIILNSQNIDIRQHRYLFSMIFSDFHLFDRFYGTPDVDEAHINDLLKLMQINHKVQFVDGKFTTLDLSTGQRKRLALAMAMVEGSPVYMFDEWAADQDPYFRKYFYEILLPTLKAQGKTIVAITHHDQYFHVADRIIKMEYGQLQPTV